MQTEWAPMSVRAAIQSQADKGNALAKFSKKLGKDSVHPRKQTWNPNFCCSQMFFLFQRGFSGSMLVFGGAIRVELAEEKDAFFWGFLKWWFLLILFKKQRYQIGHHVNLSYFNRDMRTWWDPVNLIRLWWEMIQWVNHPLSKGLNICAIVMLGKSPPN